MPDGTILSCFQKGYRMAARKHVIPGLGEEGESEAEEEAAPPGMLVRPALVKVSTR